MTENARLLGMALTGSPTEQTPLNGQNTSLQACQQ